ncbi:MAG: riboflavin biosynthesis protein RibF [Verrucomicrobiales bacterium]
MEILNHLAESLAGATLALGVFDGLHRGHQAVIEAARADGKKLGVLTFDPHPARVLAPERAPKRLLSSLPHQKRLLNGMGVETLVVLPFTPERAAQEAEDFAGELRACVLSAVAVGADWSFGRGRRGTVEKLATCLPDTEVKGVPAVCEAGRRISSTWIRECLGRSDLAMARQLLGRSFSVYGEVVKGRQLGRQLGFPTANLRIGEEYLPPDGVYAVRGDWGEGWQTGVANVGRRPTVSADGRRLLEVHFLACGTPDLYGRWVEVSFEEKIRSERSFANVGELRQQIEKDAENARMLLI